MAATRPGREAVWFADVHTAWRRVADVKKGRGEPPGKPL